MFVGEGISKPDMEHSQAHSQAQSQGTTWVSKIPESCNGN
jgi:hypothetical protein